MTVETASAEQVAPPTSAVAGIIYPPPEVRTIIDKTASFVAKNGEKFQERIRDKEIDNPKFNFLQESDPYHAYYLSKVVEIREGKVEAKKEEAPKEEEVQGKKAPTEPPPFEFSVDMPGISAQDLDVLKLTAQFMARNGRQFMTGLSQRESRNYQFDFLRPNHSLFPFFTKLVDHYTKVFAPSKAIKDTLYTNATDKSKLIAKVKERAEWVTYQEIERKRAEEEAEKEREAYAAIDWHDFGVIGAIEFTGEEDLSELPPPLDLATLQKRTLVDKKTMPLHQPQGARATPPPTSQSEIQEVNMDLEEEVEMDLEESPKEEDLPMPSLPQGPVKIVKDYVPRANIAPKPKEQVFVYQGVEVPASKLSEHVRIELLDPKWKEQKEIADQKNKESNLTSDEHVGKNLQNLAKYRTDIFGSVEVGIGSKVGGEEEKMKIMKEVNAWDGTSAITATKAANAFEEQIAAIHRASNAEEEENMVGPQVPSDVNAPPQPPLPSAPVQIAPPALPSVPMPPGILPPGVAPPLPPGMGGPPGMGAPGYAPPGIAPPGMAPPGMAPPGIRPPGMMGQPGMGMGFPGAGPPGMGARPPFPPGVPPFPPGVAVPVGSQSMEPATKKIKLDEFGLIPEEDYLANHSGPVSIRIQVQESADKGTWKLNGQTLNLSLDIAETVTKLKELLQAELDMPLNKMNLKLLTAKDPDALGFLRDQNTLAHYNINNASILQLTKKDRGRKK